MTEPSLPRKIKTQQTRKKIFDAAQALLEKHGFEYLTTKNICQKAGVSNGTFFYHFPTREDLMAYYLLINYKDYLDEQWPIISKEIDDDDFARKIIALLSIYTSYCEETGVAFISEYYTTRNKALNTRAGEIGDRKPLGVTMDIAVGLLENAQEGGLVVTSIAPLEVYLDCTTVVKGVIFEWCLADGLLDINAHLAHMLKHYLSSITTDSYEERYRLLS